MSMVLVSRPAVSWRSVCSVINCVAKAGAIAGLGVLFARKYPLTWSVLGVFTVALVLLGTRYALGKKPTPQPGREKSSVESRISLLVGNGIASSFKTIGKMIEDRSGLQKLFGEGYDEAMNEASREECLQYIESEQFQRDCSKTKIYYSKDFTSSKGEAYLSVAQRQLLMNEWGPMCKNQDVVKELLGPEAACSYVYEGLGFERTVPGLVGVFTHTPVFQVECDKVACSCHRKIWREGRGFMVDLFSVPKPALQGPFQPYFNYFVSADGVLNATNYGKYMEELFRMTLNAFFDESAATEFILPEISLRCECLHGDERKAVIATYYSSLETVLKTHRTEMWKQRAQEAKVDHIRFILLSQYSICADKQAGLDKIKDVLEKELTSGCVRMEVSNNDIQKYLVSHSLVEEPESKKIKNSVCPFVVNPCNPASRIGNDDVNSIYSFSGSIGALTPVYLAATPSHNKKMTEKSRYIAN